MKTPNTLIPMVRNYRKGALPTRRGRFPGASRALPRRFPGLFVHFASGTTIILRSAPKLNSATIGLAAHVFKPEQYLRYYILETQLMSTHNTQSLKSDKFFSRESYKLRPSGKKFLSNKVTKCSVKLKYYG